jgi:redox-sensitive bicupin YhaK (pirin superfamily)
MKSSMMPSDIAHIIIPPVRDLGGGFHVKRVLPSREQMMVGPFIFFDEMGPAHFQSGAGLDVRPHPHIGLATVTYLFQGEILHRDSLGTVQAIHPGEVNWMTAGRGIVHSERTSPAVRVTGGPIAGIQLWLALPKDLEDSAPSFAHHAAAELPKLAERGLAMTLIAGAWLGAQSPVRVHSPLFYADARLDAGARLPVPNRYSQRAVYVTEGELELQGSRIAAGQMLILREGADVALHATVASRVMVLGGEPLAEPRYIWWNLVASSIERIHEARAAWVAGRFDPVPDETEFIPAPEFGGARPRSSVD